MNETQKIISDFLLKRNLSESRINRLISENPKAKLTDEKERCPRCYSDKIRKDEVEWTNSRDGIGIGECAIYKNEVICNVCGLWLEDPNQEKPL